MGDYSERGLAAMEPYRFKRGNQLWIKANENRRRRFNALLHRAITKEDWLEAVQALVREAKAGNIRAIEIMLERVLGKPVAHVELSGSVQPNHVLIAIQEGIARQFSESVDVTDEDRNGNGNGRSSLLPPDQPLSS